MSFVDYEQNEAVCDEGGPNDTGCGRTFETTDDGPFDPDGVYVETKNDAGWRHICPECVQPSDFDWLNEDADLHGEDDDDSVLLAIALSWIKKRDLARGERKMNE